MPEAQFFERALVRAARGHLDLTAGRLHDAARARGAASVDEVLAHELVAGAVVGAMRQSDAGREAGGGDVGTTGGDLRDGLLTRAHRVEPQRHAEVLGEPAREVVRGALGPLAAEVIGVGLLRVTTRSSPCSSTCSSNDGGWPQVARKSVASRARRTFMCRYGPPAAAPHCASGPGSMRGWCRVRAAIECAALRGEVPKRS